MIDKIINVLNSWVGYLEKKSNKDLEDKTANAGMNNYTIFAEKYKKYMGINFQCQAWCHMFISTCFADAVGLEKAKELLCGNLYAYCPYGMAAFKKKGQLYKTPKKGDLVYFIRNGVARHVGIVYKVSGKQFYTIEGNTSTASGVIANGGGVCKKRYTVNDNMRFGRPKYTEEKPAASKAKKYTGTYPTLPDRGYYQNGDGIKTLTNYTTQIKRLQQLLNWVMSEDLKVDGDFGDATEKVVKAYQTKYGLKSDGKFGEKSLPKAKTISK